jgi:hypothetical protein
VTWRSPEHLPDGRRQAGDRHLKFHDERDNLPVRGRIEQRRWRDRQPTLNPRSALIGLPRP